MIADCGRYLVAQKRFKAFAEDRGETGARACFNAASSVYNGTLETDRGLRDLVVGAVDKHIAKIIDQDEGNQIILK